MFTIEDISTNVAAYDEIMQAVADIETIVQPHDAWTYQTLATLLEQDSMKLLVVYDKKQGDSSVANACIDDNETNSQLVGYCLYQVLFEQAEILRIGTHPDYQRQGIASQLFEELTAQLKRSQVVHLLLEVRADNAPAIALYEQQAFAIIHRRKGYYQRSGQSAIDALIMQRVYD
ncbi:ribosomal protein S18-alanine N-acetyltransferase [Psychrobacter sp. B38]|uniref:ribosomal protein S18-alanine N-acetyltransferase n=1 Tax=Psychrobacter sp. B38 TaxID=3143538 RepID=UPI00320DCDD7